MSKLALTFAGIGLAAALVAWLGVRSSSADDAEHAAATFAGFDASASEKRSTLDDESATADTRGERAPPAASLSIAAPATVAPLETTFTGRVVDEYGAPLAGARVGVWACGDLDLAGAQERAWTSASPADGSFTVTTPELEDGCCAVAIDAGPFRAPFWRVLRRGGVDVGERLQRGTNDLGEIALGPRGAVRGRVLAHDGRPIAGASVTRHGERERGSDPYARTDQHGVYELRGVEAGTWTIAATAREFQAGAVPFVEVRELAYSAAPDIVLAPASAVSGLVVDERGAGVAGARVLGRYGVSGYIATAETDATGAFTLQLDERGAVNLEVDTDECFRPWSLADTAAARVEPGTTGVRIQLARGDTLRFRVVDAETGACVERFAIATASRYDLVDADGGPEAVRVHARGEVELPIGTRHDAVAVFAPGFAPLSALARPDDKANASEPHVQTLRLVRGSALHGVVRLNDAPVVGARVRLARARLTFEHDAATRVETWCTDGPYDVPGPASVREGETDRDGAFRFDDLAPGSYAIKVTARRAGQLRQEPLRVPARSEVDAGTFELPPAASVRGRLVVATGTSPLGLKVHLDTPGHVRRWAEVERVDGTFTFEGLEAGDYELVHVPDGKLTFPLPSARFTLAAGETRDVELDLTHRDPPPAERAPR